MTYEAHVWAELLFVVGLILCAPFIVLKVSDFFSDRWSGRDVSDRTFGSYFCTECEKAEDGRCTVKNRQVREQSRACRGFVCGRR